METMDPSATRKPGATPADADLEQPSDEQAFWMADPMHFPTPLTPLDASVDAIFHNIGFRRAAEAYDLPVRYHMRRFHGYHYYTMKMLPLPPEQLQALGKSAEHKLQAAMGSQRRDWEERYLPEIRRQIAETEQIDFDAASTEQLARFVQEAGERLARQWEIHFLIAMPMLISQSVFEQFYRDVFGETDALNVYRLLQGLDNLTVQYGRDLWQLSRQARQDPEVLAVIQQREPAEIVGVLKETEAGRRFLAAFDAWLERNGHRGNILGVSEPFWVEDPTQVIGMLKDYVARTDYDPAAEHAQLAAAREEAVAAARARLIDYPAQVGEQFEFLLKAAQEAVVISEDHAFWIDFRALYELRRVVVAAGKRLASLGVIAQPSDMIELSLDELVTALTSPSARDWRALVAERTREMEEFARTPPAPTIGTPPAGPPPDDPVSQAMGRFFGAPPKPSEEPGLIQGTPGSKGTATGRVKVIHTLDEAHKLQPGDILVVQTTTPPWTPLFNTAAAVVTDTGGVLSHCAVVAREYGIPAVVGTGMATVILQDGDRVAVDGGAGIVRIIGG
ncbi:MAG TPA: PEP-utilizing enzyme [Thermomicrobiaceae bacterium]|nr:PEP-utilizing enzyme [Thermomicrobiaceae bacterium]